MCKVFFFFSFKAELSKTETGSVLLTPASKHLSWMTVVTLLLDAQDPTSFAVGMVE